MPTVHKVPKRISAQPHFAFGLDGLQALSIVMTVIVLGLFATRMNSITGVILFWLGIIFVGFVMFVLFRITNVCSKSLIRHTLEYLLTRARRPKRYTGRGAEDAWGEEG